MFRIQKLPSDRVHGNNYCSLWDFQRIP